MTNYANMSNTNTNAVFCCSKRENTEEVLTPVKIPEYVDYETKLEIQRSRDICAKVVGDILDANITEVDDSVYLKASSAAQRALERLLERGASEGFDAKMLIGEAEEARRKAKSAKDAYDDKMWLYDRATYTRKHVILAITGGLYDDAKKYIRNGSYFKENIASAAIVEIAKTDAMEFALLSRANAEYKERCEYKENVTSGIRNTLTAIGGVTATAVASFAVAGAVAKISSYAQEHADKKALIDKAVNIINDSIDKSKKEKTPLTKEEFEKHIADEYSSMCERKSSPIDEALEDLADNLTDITAQAVENLGVKVADIIGSGIAGMTHRSRRTVGRSAGIYNIDGKLRRLTDNEAAEQLSSLIEKTYDDMIND